MSEEKEECKCGCKKVLCCIFTVLLLYSAVLSSYMGVKLGVFNPKSQINQPNQNFLISKKYDKGQSYAKALETKKPTVVLFYVDWCQYCRHFAPVFDKLIKDKALKEHLAFAYVNCEAPENKELVAEYGVKGYPTVYFVLTDGGRIHIDNSKLFGENAVKNLKEHFLDLAGIPPLVNLK